MHVINPVTTQFPWQSLLDRQGVEETDHPAGKMPHRPRSDSEQKRLRLMEAALAAARKKEQQMKEVGILILQLCWSINTNHLAV